MHSIIQFAFVLVLNIISKKINKIFDRNNKNFYKMIINRIVPSICIWKFHIRIINWLSGTNYGIEIMNSKSNVAVMLIKHMLKIKFQ